MTAKSIISALPRLLSFALFVVAFTALLEGRPGGAAGTVLASVALYAIGRRAMRTPDAFRYRPIRAVIVPDWLGIMLGGVFFALPFFAAERGIVHPMAWMVWPMALIFLSITIIGWLKENYSLRLTDDGITIEAAFGREYVAYADVTRVTPWRRGLPRWMKALAPILILAGRFGPAGALILARDENGFAIHRKDAEAVVIASDAFEPAARAVLDALAQRGIEIPRALSRHLRGSAAC